MDAASKATGFKVNKWGVAAIATFVVAFLALAVCQRLFRDDENACFVPYILSHLSAVACGIVAAVRGSKWWLLMSLFSAALAVQAFGAMVVE
jgi:hypothetical protein